MLRNNKIEPGYHVFWGCEDTAERAISMMMEKVKAAEADFEMKSINFTLKWDEDKHGMVHAIQIMDLTPKGGTAVKAISSVPKEAVTGKTKTKTKAKVKA